MGDVFRRLLLSKAKLAVLSGKVNTYFGSCLKNNLPKRGYFGLIHNL
jgi:hypothetical protein